LTDPASIDDVRIGAEVTCLRRTHDRSAPRLHGNVKEAIVDGFDIPHG
jgi:hypothetical protein